MKQTAHETPETKPAGDDPVAVGEAAGVAGESGLAGAEPDAQTLIEERDRLRAEKASLADQLLRRRAEFDNFRKRTERERREAWEYAARNVILELLPVLDSLERALAAAPPVEDDFHSGVRLVARQFLETLERFGLKPIQAVGQQFDPNVHQAVESVATAEHPDHTVVEEWQRGYMFKDRLLRPAMVKVAVHPRARE
jgi:molecular chaperone GrpE